MPLFPVRMLCLYAVLSIVGATAFAAEDETLNYNPEIKSLLTLGNWADIGDATLVTRQGVSCGDGTCSETSLWISSEGSGSLLEKTYPLRYLYRTLYRLDERSTLAFEKLRRERKPKGPGEYEWRHRVVWLAEDQGATRYDLAASGSPLPQDVAAWITTSKAQDLKLVAKSNTPVTMKLPALDRWGTFQLLRTLELEQGASWSLTGADTKGNLGFEVKVQAEEKITAAGRDWSTWKVQIKEQEPGKPDEMLYVWFADDDQRTPVRVEMNQDIGRLRLTLR